MHILAIPAIAQCSPLQVVETDAEQQTQIQESMEPRNQIVPIQLSDGKLMIGLRE